VCSAVQLAVQNGIENLSGTSISGNAHPQDQYRFPARSKEELIQTQHLVPGVNKAELPPDDEERVRELDARLMMDSIHAGHTTPPPKAKKPEGWIL
jgi:hypothetical protein